MTNFWPIIEGGELSNRWFYLNILAGSLVFLKDRATHFLKTILYFLFRAAGENRTLMTLRSLDFESSSSTSSDTAAYLFCKKLL